MKISVLLADSKQMESQLLAASLTDRGFEVFPCASEVAPILELLECGGTDVVVISCVGAYSSLPDLSIFRTLHLMHPEIPKVCLMDIESLSWRYRPSALERADCFAWRILPFSSFANASNG